MFKPNGTKSSWLSPGGGGVLNVAIPAPLSLALDAAGNLYVLNVSGELWQLGDGSGVVGGES